jgi:hypothetical protein
VLRPFSHTTKRPTADRTCRKLKYASIQRTCSKLVSFVSTYNAITYWMEASYYYMNRVKVRNYNILSDEIRGRRRKRCQRKASSHYNFENVTGYEMLGLLDSWFRNSDHTIRSRLYKQAWFGDLARNVCLEFSSDQLSRKAMFCNFCYAANMHEYKRAVIRTWQGVSQHKDLKTKHVNIYVTESLKCGAIIHLHERLCHVI